MGKQLAPEQRMRMLDVEQCRESSEQSVYQYVLSKESRTIGCKSEQKAEQGLKKNRPNILATQDKQDQ